MLAYVCDILYICFSLYYLYSVCHRAPTHGGLGCRGADPCVNQAQNLLCPRARRAGRRSRPRPQGASFRRKREPRGVGEGRNRCKRHALKRWFGSGEVSPDGLQGRSTCRERSPSLYKKSEQAMYSLLRHEKKKQF